MRENQRIKLSELEERCLRELPVFRGICHGISENHYPDALHLWTAEVNGMDTFLSMERKFRNVIDRQKVDLRCRMMTPIELAAQLQQGTARER